MEFRRVPARVRVFRGFLAYLLVSLSATAGCGSDRPSDPVGERLAARRAALGIPREPVAFTDAMRAMGKEGWQRRLERVALGGANAEEALDVGLSIHDLLTAAGPATGEGSGTPDFAEELDRAGREARDLARAGAGGDSSATRSAAVALVATCARCHNAYRR